MGAYDLPSILIGSREGAHDMPLGVEASVGIYQAFDVGAESAPTSAASAAPPVASRPKVTPENDPNAGRQQPT